MQEGGPIQNEGQEELMQIIQIYSEMNEVSPEEIINELQNLDENQQMEVIKRMYGEVQKAYGQSQEQPEGLPGMQLGGFTPEESMINQQMTERATMNQPQNNNVGAQQDQVMQILQAYAQLNQFSEEEFNQLLNLYQNSTPEEQQNMLQEIVSELENAQGQMSEQPTQGEVQQEIQPEQPMMLNGGYLNNLKNTFQKGGMTPNQVLYKNDFNPNVNVEGDEVIKTPDGNAFKVNGNKHSEGGIDMSLPEGSLVFSEHLKAPKEIVKRFLDQKNNKSLSFADLANKYKTEKDIEVINDPEKDKYAKATAVVNLAMKNEKLNEIFTAQELFKKAAGLDMIEYTDEKQSKKFGGTLKKKFNFL
jgi:hypothetical protein